MIREKERDYLGSHKLDVNCFNLFFFIHCRCKNDDGEKNDNEESIFQFSDVTFESM